MNDEARVEPVGVWKVDPNSKARKLEPKWYHKLEFWNKWWEWKAEREYKKLKEILNE